MLIPNHEGHMQPYAWTRDGKSIVYWGAEEWSASIWGMAWICTWYRRREGLERKLGITALAHDDMLDLAPAAVGIKLAVTRARGRETWANTQIVLADLDSGAMRDLTPDDVAAQCPAWSPDGKRVAYFAAPDWR